MTVELCKDMANDAFYGVNFGVMVQCLSQQKSKCIKATTFDRKVIPYLELNTQTPV